MRRMDSWPLVFITIFFFVTSAGAAERSRNYSSKSHLTLEEINRLKDCKRILQDVDKKSFLNSRLAIEKSSSPQENLLLLEAVAQTYDDIIRDQKIVDQRKKEFLFTKINFNMAYLQLAGINTEQRQDTALNKMIRRKLREYLPDDFKRNFEQFYPAE